MISISWWCGGGKEEGSHKLMMLEGSVRFSPRWVILKLSSAARFGAVRYAAKKRLMIIVLRGEPSSRIISTDNKKRLQLLFHSHLFRLLTRRPTLHSFTLCSQSVSEAILLFAFNFWIVFKGDGGRYFTFLRKESALGSFSAALRMLFQNYVWNS